VEPLAPAIHHNLGLISNNPHDGIKVRRKALKNTNTPIYMFPNTPCRQHGQWVETLADVCGVDGDIPNKHLDVLITPWDSSHRVRWCMLLAAPCLSWTWPWNSGRLFRSLCMFCHGCIPGALGSLFLELKGVGLEARWMRRGMQRIYIDLSWRITAWVGSSLDAER